VPEAQLVNASERLLIRTAEILERDGMTGVGAYSAFHAATFELFPISRDEEGEREFLLTAWEALWNAWGELGGGRRAPDPYVASLAARRAAVHMEDLAA
jgi:hypothetical protein